MVLALATPSDARKIVIKRNRMTTYYVNTAVANDNGTGAIGDPWKTIAKVNGSTFAAGDSVLFNKGNVWYEQLVPPSSGSAGGGYITFGSYGTGAAPILSGYKTLASFTNSSGNIWYATGVTRDIGHVVTAGGTVLPTKRATQGECVAQGDLFYDSGASRLYLYSVGNPATFYLGSLYGAQFYTGGLIAIATKNYVTIQDLAVTGSGSHGIQAAGVDHVQILRNTVYYIGGAYLTGTTRYGNGVEIWNDGTNVFVDSNVISQTFDEGLTSQSDGSNTRQDQTFTQNTVDHCGQAFSCSVAGGTPTIDRIYVAENIFTNSGLGWSTVLNNQQGIAVSLVGNATNSVFSNNLIDTTASGADPIGQGIVIYNADWLVTRNVIKNTHNSAVRAYGDPTLWFTYNVIIDPNGSAGFFSTGDDTNNNYTFIYNNTFYASDNADTVMLDFGADGGYGVTKHVVINNIVYNGGTNAYPIVAVSSASDVWLNSNMYYRVGGGNLIKWSSGTTYTQAQWSTYKSDTGADSNSPVPADPLFTSATDMRLQFISPCINRGEELGLATDLLGNPIKGLPDLGAYEYQTGRMVLK